MKEVSCNYCGSSDYKVIYGEKLSAVDDSWDFTCTNDHHGEHYRVVKCNLCGLFYSSPRPDGKNLEVNYNLVEDSNYKSEIEGRKKTFQRNLKNVLRFKIKGDLLDVGCALGVFLAEAQKKEWSVSGIEPSEWCVNQCRELFDLQDVVVGTYRNLSCFGRKFDLVTMWDVLEHLDDPLVALKNCADVLNEDGILAFSTVNIGSIYAKILGKRWPWLMKMHIYYFDKKTIRQYLKKIGFEILEIRQYKHTISADYLLYKLKRINKILYYTVVFIKRIIFLDRNIYLTVCMGDFMEVYARRIERTI
ncbi:MAG: hypothetical protein A2Y03_02440 [Omnitrophica WOR_2 bacterium GWF2_38_59]|nr:MAG: hypothetical protein A2Y03_02440 [Omnitrophica WOR_2 bacterium GWF2_38_59]OGX48292.1 MAG: hypothetical protein A2243_10460 [Omnitrophica WOR_2 bacterium RIFOXYA2_FULL_38_17]OGX51819.1 MAG: hypothetical protein A2267_05935 [Omnitrophica WOR_2 bacterium RIFOXYA12_FULL_38_10]OGX59544.1 MAG: hypothetical protein A2447_11840 [Omnitrophica WOR_2 bacterium RIFOXYC2_FULL_38_12]OGX59935.1 MAG: hypothetical protein A2306_04375 [Omnitrophica WOR_2 bacterium RIFOXYB2_FULL_38_16]